MKMWTRGQEGEHEDVEKGGKKGGHEDVWRDCPLSRFLRLRRESPPPQTIGTLIEPYFLFTATQALKRLHATSEEEKAHTKEEGRMEGPQLTGGVVLVAHFCSPRRLSSISLTGKGEQWEASVTVIPKELQSREGSKGPLLIGGSTIGPLMHTPGLPKACRTETGVRGTEKP